MDQASTAGASRGKKTFILCFDGTGNKFNGDETDSNILKIYRMLDRVDGNTFTFYQPGIGTYVSSNHFQTTGTIAKIKSWYVKSKDAAVGSSFAEHVMGGYEFLMRYYSSEDDLYFFGFSRGAYTARFLAEMLDHVGLLSAGNEELARFAWKTYAKWTNRGPSNTAEGKRREDELYRFMRGFRDTFSRVVRRIRFLGLFDTVNSVAAFEGPWLQRTKFPYTAKSSAKVIRHAVAIDERRAKFRQDLISGSRLDDRPQVLQYASDELVVVRNDTAASVAPSVSVADEGEKLDQLSSGQPEARLGSVAGDIALSTEDFDHKTRRRYRRWSDVRKTQDILEVWFPGGHGDIGGGWRTEGDTLMLAHVPLVWMIEEAQKAGLRFDAMKMQALHCCPDKVNDYGEREQCADSLKAYHDKFSAAGNEGRIHDCLLFKGGLPWASVAAWKVMEYLPFRRMDLKPDGSWQAIRWPLPCGETRDVPAHAQIHVSAIRRMERDQRYRPGNLIVGGGGRGVRHAPGKYGMGEWRLESNEGRLTHETYVRRDSAIA